MIFCYDKAMDVHQKWFRSFSLSKEYNFLKQHPVVYFCTEYALNSKMPMAGGLGVLASDTVKEAYDRQFPMVAIALFYRKGYKTISGPTEDRIITPQEFGLKPALNSLGERVAVTVPLEKGEVTVKAWIASDKTIPIYFLDTNNEENEPWASEICEYLYVGDRNLRIMQEIILGVGGVRFIRALGIEPSIYHMNDSYSAFLIFELARAIMEKQKLPFKKAMELSRNKVAYTNHTLVAMGNDAYRTETIENNLENYARPYNFSAKDLLIYGHVSGENKFSMTMMALKTAGVINCVSRFHGEEAREIWPEFEISSITNGIHLPTWDKISTPEDIISSHKENKRELLEIMNKETGDAWREDELLICWAKRIVSYKRPLSLFSDIKRLSQIVKDEKRPVRLIFAGVPHYSDKHGIEMMEKIKGYAQNELREHLAYIDNYSVDVAAKLVSGSDVWLNTPKVGWEACGTSTMKAALNGCLNCSTKDGWLAEVGLNKIGWEIQDSNVGEDILDLLEHHIVPCYYANDSRNEISIENWESKMKTGRNLVLEDFSTSRMLKEYIEKLYLPPIEK